MVGISLSNAARRTQMSVMRMSVKAHPLEDEAAHGAGGAETRHLLMASAC
jgi:hypothetical protein